MYLIDLDALAGTIAIKISHIIKTFLADYLVNDQVLPEKPESEKFLAFKVLPKSLFRKCGIPAH